MTKTEDDDGYYATISPYTEGWLIRYYINGHHHESEAYSFRWVARMVARHQVKRMRKDPEVIR